MSCSCTDNNNNNNNIYVIANKCTNTCELIY